MGLLDRLVELTRQSNGKAAEDDSPIDRRTVAREAVKEARKNLKACLGDEFDRQILEMRGRQRDNLVVFIGQRQLDAIYELEDAELAAAAFFGDGRGVPELRAGNMAYKRVRVITTGDEDLVHVCEQRKYAFVG